MQTLNSRVKSVPIEHFKSSGNAGEQSSSEEGFSGFPPVECCKEPNFEGPNDEDEKKCLLAQFASYECQKSLGADIWVDADKVVVFCILTSKNQVEKLIIVRILRETKSALEWLEMRVER
jgi:hypothetical protein